MSEKREQGRTSTRMEERTRRAEARISWLGSFSPFWNEEMDSSAMSGSSSAYRTTNWYVNFFSSTDLHATFLGGGGVSQVERERGHGERASPSSGARAAAPVEQDLLDYS
jgi:hypothetical protein